MGWMSELSSAGEDEIRMLGRWIEGGTGWGASKFQTGGLEGDGCSYLRD
jgi:hypothetical protein